MHHDHFTHGYSGECLGGCVSVLPEKLKGVSDIETHYRINPAEMAKRLGISVPAGASVSVSAPEGCAVCITVNSHLVV